MSSKIGDKVFIVHGHDGDTKLQVAEFVERITGKRPVILHEQADSGRTIIEKFEEHASEAGFAIILLTADDEGKAKGATQLNPRARQNVVLEFGYFMAKLGRRRVVALHESGVELPSDVSGVLYKSLTGNWHTGLAQELKAANIEIDFSRLFS
jgi:predicted nucleotide-binding protein